MPKFKKGDIVWVDYKNPRYGTVVDVMEKMDMFKKRIMIVYEVEFVNGNQRVTRLVEEIDIRKEENEE